MENISRKSEHEAFSCALLGRLMLSCPCPAPALLPAAHVPVALRILAMWAGPYACSHMCGSLCVTSTLLVTGIFLEARPPRLDGTFQPSTIVHWDNRVLPGRWQAWNSKDGLDLMPAWEERWDGAGLPLAWPRAQSGPGAAGFVRPGSWDTTSTKKINISRLQRSCSTFLSAVLAPCVGSCQELGGGRWPIYSSA